MGSFFLPNWSPPDDPARPLPAEGRPWPSDDDDDVDLLVRPPLLLSHVPKPEQPIPLRTVGHSKIVIHSDLFSLRNIIQTL